MQLSMWTYPWDVQDIGYEAVENDLRDRAGLRLTLPAFPRDRPTHAQSLCR